MPLVVNEVTNPIMTGKEFGGNQKMKKLLSLLLALSMIFSLVVTQGFSAMADGASNFAAVGVQKMIVDEDGSKTPIGIWLDFFSDFNSAEAAAILDGISFKLYASNADGDNLGLIDYVEGKIYDDSMIYFEYVPGGGFYGFSKGWYLIEEVLTGKAKDALLAADKLLVFFNGIAFSDGNNTIDPNAKFEITQYGGKDNIRLVQAVYRDEDGNVTGKVYVTPALGIPNRPNNGGGTLGTSKFTAKDKATGTEYMSFCADIGALGVKGEYAIDDSNHGLSDAQVYKLIAALDCVYDTYGFDFYEGIALAQLVVWNVILEFTDDPMVADYWLKTLNPEVFYKDVWGELFKIEGNEKDPAKWYTPAYKAFINDILENLQNDKYTDIYEARVRDGASPYVSGAYFLKGTDTRYADYLKQRQVVITFDDPVTFDNTPDEVTIIGLIGILKRVVDGDNVDPIGLWLFFQGLDEDQINEILSDIYFEVWHSNEFGDAVSQISGVKGIIEDYTSSIINFYDSNDDPYNFSPGYYLIREIMGSKASALFVSNVPDLHFYYNGTTISGGSSVSTSYVIPDDARFIITQHGGKENIRLVQALYRKDGLLSGKVYVTPALGIPNRPNNGGGTLGTSRFTATEIATGFDYMSFCADIGALGVKGIYAIDENNHGLSSDQVYKLIAALDHVYATYGFDAYEGIALAQLVVWNLILEYTDDPMIADYWLKTLNPEVFYKDVWGELFKIEGNEKDPAKWYTPAYRAFIDDILAHANDNKYVDIYEARILSAERYISNAVFLKGIDTKYADYLKQRQVLIQFDDGSVTFDNEPRVDVVGDIKLTKQVIDGNEVDQIGVWLYFEGLDEEEIEEILADIHFELWISNDAYEPVSKVDGYIGVIDHYLTSVIEFLDADGNSYDFTPGYYLVREVMGDKAKALFDDVPDMILHVYSYYDDDLGREVVDTETKNFYNRKKVSEPGALEVIAEAEYSYEKVVYEPEYGKFSNNTKTLVSWRNGGQVPGSTHGNGFTMLLIDIAQASTDEGIVIGIADSSPSNRYIGCDYTVHVKDGWLTISFANLVSVPNFGFILSSTMWNGNPNSDIKHDKIATRQLPAGVTDTVYLFFHIDGGISWYGTEVIKWNVVDRETITEAYEGVMLLTIAGPDGFFYEDDDFGGYYLLDPADAGEYTVTLSGSGVLDDDYDFELVEVVNVVDGAKITVDFGTITVIGPDEEIGKF